jgi:hypothetical protein
MVPRGLKGLQAPLVLRGIRDPQAKPDRVRQVLKALLG